MRNTDKVKIIHARSTKSAWALSELERRINECIRENRGVIHDIKINIVSRGSEYIDDLYIATIIFSDPFDNVVPEVTFE